LTSTVSATGQPSFTTAWAYDPAENLTSVTLPDNSKLTYGYDSAHRLISVTDLFSNNIGYTLDPLGDVTLTNVSNPTPTITRTHSGVFDALGRMLQDIGGAGQTTTYTYDNNGNALTITDPNKNLTQQGLRRPQPGKYHHLPVARRNRNNELRPA
jgi:YD repeat-containing protein